MKASADKQSQQTLKEDEKMVKCIDCGYLASRNITTRQLDETDANFRKNCEPPHVRDFLGHNPHSGWEAYPICFVQANDLIKEFEQVGKTSAENVKTVINKERECPPFIMWRQGHNPKEHQEREDRKAMLEWQAIREDADRKYQIKHLWLTVIVAGIFTILGGVIGAVIALIAKG